MAKLKFARNGNIHSPSRLRLLMYAGWTLAVLFAGILKIQGAW